MKTKILKRRKIRLLIFLIALSPTYYAIELIIGPPLNNSAELLRTLALMAWLYLVIELLFPQYKE